MVLRQILGGLSILAGLAMIISFPDIADYQTEEFGRVGVLIGIFLVLLGIFLVRL